MDFRICNENDICKVGEFYDKVVLHLYQTVNYPRWKYKIYPTETTVRKRVEVGQQFVCVDDNKVLGAFVLNEDPQGKYENADWKINLSDGEYLVCHTLAIDPEVYGKGIGTQIVEFCIRYAKERGYKAIRLDVVPDNVPAKRLYEKCGFQYVGDVDLERDIEEIPIFSMYENVLLD